MKERSLLRTVKMRQEVNEVRDDVTEEMKAKTQEEIKEKLQEDFRNIDRYAENIDRDSELLRLLSHHPERGMEAILDEYGAAVDLSTR